MGLSRGLENTVRESLTGEQIRVFGCYGYGSLGALYCVSLPNALHQKSQNGMGEHEIRAQYPHVVRDEP